MNNNNNNNNKFYIIQYNILKSQYLKNKAIMQYNTTEQH